MAESRLTYARGILCCAFTRIRQMAGVSVAQHQAYLCSPARVVALRIAICEDAPDMRAYRSGLMQCG